jgi:hypothetical protein
MSVLDLHHEAARRYVDAMPLTDFARTLLQRLGVPAWAAFPPFVNDLARVLRNVLEAALIESLTIPELAALARFYATPAGAAVMRKLLAFNDAVTPALEAAVSAWARELAARIRAAQSSADVPALPKEDPR